MLEHPMTLQQAEHLAMVTKLTAQFLSHHKRLSYTLWNFL